MNLREVFRTLGVPFVEGGSHSLVTDGWIGTPCPYCDRGRGNPGLGVHVRTLRTSCWRCGAHGLAAALAEITGRRAAEIRALLGDLAPSAPEPVRTGKLVVPPGVDRLLPAHRRYLAGRGFDPDELVERWGVGGIGPNHGPLSWRVYIPIRDELGTQVSWTTRAIGNVPHGVRYRGASREQSAVPRGDCLLGIEHVRHAVIVTEGPMDAFWGGPGFVATAGVGFSRAQVLKLSSYPIRVICFDPDSGGRLRAGKLAAQLSPFSGETHLAWVSGDDPASSPRAEAAELRRRFLE